MRQDGSPGRHALTHWQTMLIFVGWTLFSVYIYSRYSQLGDSAAYLAGDYGDSAQMRTQVISAISSRVAALFGGGVFAHLVFSLFAAAGVAHLASQADVRGRYRWPLLAILLTPNFGVWASVVGRESLFVGLLGFFLGAVIGYYRKPALHRVLLALVCLAGMIFIRGPYGIGLALFFVIFLAYRSGPRTRMSLGVQSMMLSLIAMVALIVCWPVLDRAITDDVLPRAQSFFTIGSATTRTWVDLDTAGDLFTSLWWTLPLAIVGPTPAEALARPVMLPFLFSGMVVLGSLLYSIAVAMHTRGLERKILLLGWLPAMTVILIAYVPFGIYNPGSGIRYASCFLLFLVFPSMLCSAASATARTDHSRVSRSTPFASGMGAR